MYWYFTERQGSDSVQMTAGITVHQKIHSGFLCRTAWIHAPMLRAEWLFLSSYNQTLGYSSTATTGHRATEITIHLQQGVLSTTVPSIKEEIPLETLQSKRDPFSKHQLLIISHAVNTAVLHRPPDSSEWVAVVSKVLLTLSKGGKKSVSCPLSQRAGLLLL